MRSNFYDLLGSPQPFDTQRNYVTSPWFSPTILAVIRGTIAFYTLFALLFILIWQAVIEGVADSYFSYFTELTYIGICSYYWASFTQTLVYARRLRQSPHKTPEYPLQKWPRILQLLHVMLGTTIVSFPILVTIVFWGLLASSSVFSTKFNAWSNISIHALNTVWSLFEMIGTNSPPPRWPMLPFMIFILALYLALAYVTYATQRFYPYAFLNPAKEHDRLAVYIIGIAVAGCVVFSLAKTIMWIRMRAVSRKQARATGGLDDVDDVMESREMKARPGSSSSILETRQSNSSV